MKLYKIFIIKKNKEKKKSVAQATSLAQDKI